ncbi:hypothetical protein Ahy_B10g105731 isoform A [Arachis hypogaea]|uniref:PI-PLC X domain-containing protein n=1 Tax=Arachis hypogaea TaxID=3818 RepID=A0A444X8Q6_ARAHY|nr:hypothetical protein Ahy_B10g105731 isoform A [Arachis hypogaea]
MGSLLFLLLVIFTLCNDAAADCSNGDCMNNSLPFNKYAYLTTHNAFAIDGEPSQTGVPQVTITNQEDSITHQLSNGVRGLMLGMYDFDGDVWLCHSSQGQCHDYTAFEPAIGTLKEIEAFLSANPSEIVTLILEDYIHTQNGLKKVFSVVGLKKFWFPVTNMPRNGGNWSLVSDMVAKNRRLIVFTSVKSKEQSEGIAYQWNYMVENQYGDGGRKTGSCPNRAESSNLDDKSKSLVLFRLSQLLVQIIRHLLLTCCKLNMVPPAIDGQISLPLIITRRVKKEDRFKLWTC